MAAPTESTPFAPKGTEPQVPETISLKQLGMYFGFRYFHLRLLAIAPLSLGVACSIVGASPLLLDGVQDEYGVANAWVSLVHTGVLLGSLPGVVFFGALADRSGRKYTIQVCVALVVVLSILCFFMPSGPAGFAVLLVVRVLLGFPYGGLINVVMTYVGEFSCDDLRGIVLVAVNFGWAVGGIYSITLVGILGRDEWRLYFSVAPVLPALVYFTCSPLLPESPRWLRVTGSTKEAQEVLDYVFSSSPAIGEAYVGEAPQVTLEANVNAASNPSFAEVVKELFRPELLQITLVSGFAYAILAGTSNSVDAWAPRILEKVGGYDAGYEIFTVSILVGVVATLGVCFTLDRVGRRPLIWVGFFGHVVAFAGLATASGMDMAKAMWLVHCFFEAPLWAGCITYITEAFPTAVRTSAMGITMVGGRLLSVIMPMGLGWLFAQCSISTIMLLVSASYCGGLLVSLFIPAETARQAMDDSMPSQCA